MTKVGLRIIYQIKLPIINMTSGDVGHMIQSSSPCAHLLLKSFFIFIKRVCKSSLLFPHIRWIHVVKNRQNCHSHFFAGNDLYKFVYAPSWRGIIFWENDHSKSGFFYCFEELCLNSFSFLKFFIILKSINALLF